MSVSVVSLVFFFNDTATTEIYTLSLHDALPISPVTGSKRESMCSVSGRLAYVPGTTRWWCRQAGHCRRLGSNRSSTRRDRKSTRLNSSHANISYAVFCLKKKNNYLDSAIEIAHV